MANNGDLYQLPDLGSGLDSGIGFDPADFPADLQPDAGGLRTTAEAGLRDPDQEGVPSAPGARDAHTEARGWGPVPGFAHRLKREARESAKCREVRAGRGARVEDFLPLLPFLTSRTYLPGTCRKRLKICELH